MTTEHFTYKNRRHLSNRFSDVNDKPQFPARAARAIAIRQVVAALASLVATMQAMFEKCTLPSLHFKQCKKTL
jgi:DNA-binding transcriptional regulator YbjK